MDKRLYVREGDLEVVGKRLDITMHINQQESRYFFPKGVLSHLLVEERENKRVALLSVAYLPYARLLLPPHNSKNQKLYDLGSKLAQQLDDLFLRLIHGEKYATILPAEERRPLTQEDLDRISQQKTTFLDVDEKNKAPESPFFKGELCQAIEGYLRNYVLPRGMILQIPPFFDEPEDPFAYSLQIDLSK